MNWFCSQLGAREHYAIPRALHHAEKLNALYTDFWAGPVLRKFARGPLRSLATRWHPGLEVSGPELVRSWNCRTVTAELKSKVEKQKAELGGRYREFIEIGSQFAVAVREDLKRRDVNPKETIFFGYDTASLETLAWCRERGIKCVVDQMDPNRTEFKLVQEEEKQWPEWVPGHPLQKSVVSSQWSVVSDDREAYFRRREREWELADRVVVNSRWSLDALVQQGVPREKLVVIPLCYECDPGTTRQQDNRTTGQRNSRVVSGQWSSGPRNEPLRVLFLGQVILRKGIQYLIEAAKLLQNEPVQFDIVGPVGISEAAVNAAPKNVRFHGRATRDQAANWYEQADLFALPTISDGFALTQLEAMAHGLPVITTQNCGEVITNEADGFIVPARDATALAKAILQYCSDPKLLAEHRKAAFEKSKLFSLGRLQRSLLDLEAELIHG